MVSMMIWKRTNQYKMASSSHEGKVDQSYIIGFAVSSDGFDDGLEKDNGEGITVFRYED
jgi:hypothetical protein